MLVFACLGKAVGEESNKKGQDDEEAERIFADRNFGGVCGIGFNVFVFGPKHAAGQGVRESSKVCQQPGGAGPGAGDVSDGI